MATSSADTTTNGQAIGRVVQIIGPVVDVEFLEKQLPPIYQLCEFLRGFDVPRRLNLIARCNNTLGRAVSHCLHVATDGMVRGMSHRYRRP